MGVPSVFAERTGLSGLGPMEDRCLSRPPAPFRSISGAFGTTFVVPALDLGPAVAIGSPVRETFPRQAAHPGSHQQAHWNRDPGSDPEAPVIDDVGQREAS